MQIKVDNNNVVLYRRTLNVALYQLGGAQDDFALATMPLSYT